MAFVISSPWRARYDLFIYITFVCLSICVCVCTLIKLLFILLLDCIILKGMPEENRTGQETKSGLISWGLWKVAGLSSVDPHGGRGRGQGSRGQGGRGWSTRLRDRWPQRQGHRRPPGHRGKGQRRSWGCTRRPSIHRGHVWQRALNCFDSVRTIFNYYSQAISNNK